MLQYFVNDLKVNLKIAFTFPYTSNEFSEEEEIDVLIKDHDHLYGFLLAVYSRDTAMLTYLYEEMREKL